MLGQGGPGATPQGDQTIIYLEGNDLQRAFQVLERALDPFTVWLGQWLEDFFDGVDLTQISPGSLSQYVYDIPSVQEDIARSHTLEAMEHLSEISP